MSIDLKMELAKQDYINAINEIINKYELPLSISEIILSGICNEIHNLKMKQLMKEQEELSKQKELSEQEKEDDK